MGNRIYSVAFNLLTLHIKAVTKEHRFVKKLGQSIRQLRDDREFSQMALASEAGLDKTYIGLIERAEVNPTVGTLLKIAEALGVELVVEFRQRKPR
jgi:ribosome-binding protein aMBF1 (putative translation factor)